MTTKLIICLLFGSLLSFVTVDKENTYTFTEGQVIIVSNSMAQAKQLLLNSDIPAKQVMQVTALFDSIQNVIVAQYKVYHPKP